MNYVNMYGLLLMAIIMIPNIIYMKNRVRKIAKGVGN